MSETSYQFTITKLGNGFQGYCEEVKQVTVGHGATSFGTTPLEAISNTYQSLIKSIEEDKQLNVDLVLEDLIAQSEADQEAGNLIPGGFGGNGELSDELEAALKTLITAVNEGMTEREQLDVAHDIKEALAIISMAKWAKELQKEKTTC